MAKKMRGIIICGNDMGVCPVEDVDYVMVDEKDYDQVADLAVDGDTDAIYDELSKGCVNVPVLLKIAVAARDLVKSGATPAALEKLQQAVNAPGSSVDLIPS